MPDAQTLLLVLTIAVALFFDFTNGFHDTANAIGTAIGTRALPPRLAVGLSAVLNLVGAVVTTQLLHAEVANTVGSLVAPAGGVAMSMLIAVLFGAITWNLFTWRAGLPSSSSHALIGALIGMGRTAYGIDAVQWGEVVPRLHRIDHITYCRTYPRVRGDRSASQPASAEHVRAKPTTCFAASDLLQRLRRLQPRSKRCAEDDEAIITLALFSSSIGVCCPDVGRARRLLAIGLGTSAGRWRIIRTMGTRIVRMDPCTGFSAQTVAASVIQVATAWGLPVSTTQVVCAGAVMGAGTGRRFRAVRWGVARRLVWAWVFTIPASAALAALGVLLINVGALAVTLAILTLGLWLFINARAVDAAQAAKLRF